MGTDTARVAAVGKARSTNGGRRGRAHPPQSKSAVADFDHFMEWPKPAYTRFRQGEGRTAEGRPGWGDAASPQPLHGRHPLQARKSGPTSPLQGEVKQGDLPSPALYRLMTWMSPAYPVGAFSYSGGLEWAVEAGDIRDAQSLTGWLTAMIRYGSVSCDAAIF